MKRFAFLLSLIFCLNAAYAFTLDGIVYSDSISSNTVSVSGYTSDLPAAVVIPSEVTYEGTAYTVAAIDSIAFKDCTSLTSIEIPSSVTRIAVSAFDGCTSLTSVVISDGNDVLTIDGIYFYMMDDEWPAYGEYTILFEDCPLREVYLGRNLSYLDHCSPFCNKMELSKLTIGNSVTEIGRSAFYGCTSLSAVEIPDNATEVGDCSFSGCESLTSVVLPDSIGKIGKYAFADCSSLTSIKIPDGITTIERFLFGGCSSLASIVVPKNVTTIIGSAFWGCTSLTSVTVSDGTDILTILGKNSSTDDDYPFVDESKYQLFNGNPLAEVYLGRNLSYDSAFSPFKDKKDLTKVTIGNSVTKIGNSAFSGCSSLASIIIPNNIMEIDDCAFSDCVLLASVEIPSGVTTIGKAAFSGCAILSSIDIPNRVMTIGDNAFKGCTSLISVNISEAPDTLTISGNECSLFGDSPLKKVSLGRNLSYSSFHSPFRDRNKLSKVTISDTVTELGDSLFAGCKTLAAIAIPNSVTRIGNSAFAGCNVLTSIAIPDSIKELGNSVFSGCSALSSITIPEGVTRIEDSTFQECTSLESIVIPGSIKELGDSVFSGCSALSSIIIPDGVTRIGDSTFQECSSLESIVIPGTIKELGNSVFSGCSALSSITIPDGVTRIGDSTFQGCVSLDSIAIPGGVLMIGDSAFRGCISLNSIAIPGSVVMIKNFTFSDCTSLRSVTFFDGNKALEFGYSVFNGTSLNEVYLDRNISGYNFFSPFRNQKELSKVTIGNSVTSIGNYTFEGCSSLTSIELPTSVSKIGSSAFSNCTSLVSIGMHDSVIEIGRAAFSGCTSLAFIEIPNSIRRIGDSAFSYCTSLLSITIPDGVMNIGGSIFDGCRSLTSVVISDSEDTLTIDGSTFRFFASCSLNEIYLGRNLSYEMEYSPFHDQNRLSKVTIGECVTDLTSDTFHGCENIRTIVAYHDLNIGSTAFEEEVLYRANIVIKGNKDLVLGISESQWNRFSHVYYEEDSKLYLPVFWNIRLDCPEAFYSKDNGCLVSSDYLVATVYDSSDSNVAVYFRSDNVLESLVSDEGFKFTVKSVWKDNDFYVVNKDESGNLHNVFVLNPGQLTDEIGVDNFQTVKVLTVSGNLNGTDIAAINEMTSLRFLDMRQANIVEGGEAYCGNLKTENNVFGDDFFRNMKNLSTIILPESVKSIGSCVINTCIKSVIIPDGIIEIGNYAFSGCSSLSSIEIPNSVTTIGESAFSGCSSLSSTEIPQNITVIGESAFKDCLSLTSVIILDGNKELNIRESAFDGCKLNEMYWGRNLDKGCYGMPLGFKESLLKVTIGRDVTRIIPYAFRGCSSLKSVTILDGAEIIGCYAFQQCDSLESIELSSHITEIGESAFSGCTSLASIKLPTNVGTISDRMFEACYSLSAIELPKNLRTIGSFAFAECKSLSSIDLPNSLWEIEWYAFFNCTSLVSIEIPYNVTRIGESAFAHCCSLKEIRSLNMYPPYIERNTFSYVDKDNCQLRIPKGSLERYKGDQYWKEFLNISDDLVVLNQLPKARYGDAEIDLAEYAPEGVALAYESSDNNIARVDGNKLTICGAGEVTVSASLVWEDSQLELIDPVRKFVVGKAELTATAQSYEIKQGDPMPEFAIIYDGFVYDDNAGDLRELPVISCTAKDTSVPGEYEISLSGGYDENYDIKTVNGLLTIKPVSGVSDIEGDAKRFSCTVTDGQIRISGLVAAQTVAIYDANGRMCYRADAAEDGMLTYRPDTAGVYIVRSGSQSVKVIVR